MKQLTCEMCGSTELIKQEGFFVCQTCGTKYSVEEAKKMMIEGTVDVQGTVKIDTTSQLENLYILARRAKESNNCENASDYYKKIAIENPNDWEANFYSVYFTSKNCKLSEISSAASNVTNACIESLELIFKNVDEKNKTAYYCEIADATSLLLCDFVNAARNHYLSYISVTGAEQEFDYRVRVCVNGDVQLGNFFYDIGRKKIAAVYYGNAQNLVRDGMQLEDYVIERIKEVNPSYEPPQKSGCYVATCVYGSYDCPEVWALRRFRDDTLGSTWYGRLFIRTYYAISPTLVKWFGHTKWFKKMWKGTLDRMVSGLRAKGVEDTPYNDIEWRRK